MKRDLKKIVRAVKAAFAIGGDYWAWPRWVHYHEI